MASNLKSSIHSGPDSLLDFSCFTCKGKDINKKADFNCEECSKFFCCECVKYHNFLFNKHVTFGRENISQWPAVSNAVFDVLEQCQEHKTEKLKVFCEDHNELICTICHVYKHQKCTHVVLITDKVKCLRQGDFKQLSTSLETSLGQLIQKKCDFDEKMKTLEKSYKKILEEINTLRKTINASLDELERNTIKELHKLLDSLKTSFQTDIDQCTKFIRTMTSVQEDWQNINNESETIHLIMYRKCLHQSIKLDAVLQKLKAKNESTLTFEPDTTIERNLSALSGLGHILSKEKQSQTVGSTTQDAVTRETKPKVCDSMSSQYFHTVQTTAVVNPGPESGSDEANEPSVLSDSNKVIKVRCGKYSIRVKEDGPSCNISGVCEIATGKFLISDMLNHKVKLLDQDYKVVAHCKLPVAPWSMCRIDSTLVAVAIGLHGIHLIRVTNAGQLVQDKTLQLLHFCRCITHQQGNMYVTSSSELFHYTVDGSLVSKLYEVTAENITSCAVSPDGDRIYLGCSNPDQLVTLSKDGTVISKMNMYQGCGLNVTEMGQVLVCGYSSNVILQVDRDGRHTMAKVVTGKDGVDKPMSVCYSKHTETLIVGMWENNNILVFTTQ